jgi:hypothetical protein
MTPAQTAPRQHADAPQIPPDPLAAFIETRLRRNETPRQIAGAVKDTLGIEIDRDQVIPYWKGEIALPTQTERRPDKESVQLAADEEKEPLFTRMACDETPDRMSETPDPAPASSSIAPDPDPVSDGAEEDVPATQTGPRQEEPSVTPIAHDDMLEALAALARARLGIAPDPAPATQTGRRQNPESASTLTDEVKVFIVKALACFDSPSKVAEDVKLNFGIEISRQRVFAYDPEGSRPPAPRWRELHAATRRAFLQETAGIGIAHKAVRLRMLNRLAQRCERNGVALALVCLREAAKECGGMYEKWKTRTAPEMPHLERSQVALR